MNWGELKQAALEKLDEPDGDRMEELKTQMIRACNEGAVLLCQSGRLLLHSAQFAAKQGEPVFLPEYASGYLETESIFYQEKEGWRQTQRYQRIGREYFMMERTGNYMVFFYAAPQPITENTPESMPCELPEEAAVLLPLYMASQLYKHDSPQLAMLWRNEFEQGREELSRRAAELRGRAEIMERGKRI